MRVLFDRPKVVENTLRARKRCERSQVRLENGDLASYEMQKKRRDSHDIQQNAKTRHELKRLKQAA